MSVTQVALYLLSDLVSAPLFPPYCNYSPFKSNFGPRYCCCSYSLPLWQIKSLPAAHQHRTSHEIAASLILKAHRYPVHCVAVKWWLSGPDLELIICADSNNSYLLLSWTRVSSPLFVPFLGSMHSWCIHAWLAKAVMLSILRWWQVWTTQILVKILARANYREDLGPTILKFWFKKSFEPLKFWEKS